MTHVIAEPCICWRGQMIREGRNDRDRLERHIERHWETELSHSARPDRYDNFIDLQLGE